MGRRKMTSHPRTDGSLNQTGKRLIRSLHNRPISMFPRRFCTVPHAAIPARATRVNSYSQKLFAPHTRRPLSTTTPKYTARSATACRKIAAICRNIEVPGLGITTSGHGRGAPCSGAPGYPKVVLMASFVKIAPPKPEKFPILRLYPHPSRIIGPSQRSYPAAQKTDRTGRPQSA